MPAVLHPVYALGVGQPAGAEPFAQCGQGMSPYAVRHGAVVPIGNIKGIEPFEKIRAACGASMDIMLECHSLWSLPAAVQIARALEPYNLYWIEDPVPANGVASLASFKRQTGARVTASETIATRQGFRELMAAGAVDIVMLDIAWVGGLTEAKAIAGMAEAWHLPVAPHDCTGPLAFATAVQFTLSVPNVLCQESVRAFHSGWYRELAEDLPEIEDGHILPPPGDGLGTHLKPAVWERPDATVVRSGA